MASILTNSSAMTALSVLRKTNDELSVTQSRISTGMKVGSAKDNASFWAVSQVMKSDVGAYKAIGDNLSLAQASTSVARDGAEKIADLISKIKGKVTSAQEGSLDKAKIQADVDSMLSQIGEISKSANFNGVNLLESSDTVKLLSSLGRSDSGVAASYISFDAVNLTMDDGGLAALDGLSVMSRGDQVLNNETDGVTSFTIAQSATALAQGDKLKFTYVDADGVERTLTHTVSQAIAADATGGQKLVDELNANASFSKQFKITYDGANTQFKLSAADRDSDIQVTNWSGNSFATASNRQWVNTYGAVANANGNAAQAMTIAFTDTAGKSVTLSFTADTDDAVDDNVAASIQTACGLLWTPRAMTALGWVSPSMVVTFSRSPATSAPSVL